MKTLIPEGLANIKPTDPFRLANQTARRKLEPELIRLLRNFAVQARLTMSVQAE